MKHNFKIIAFALFALAAASYSGAINLAGMEMQQPDSAAQAEEQETSPEYNEQYEAWEKAKDEPDIQKSAAMLIQFLEKYPKSELLKHAENSYVSLLIKCSEEKKFQDLETLAEKWLKASSRLISRRSHSWQPPRENLVTMRSGFKVCLRSYKIQPSGSLANEIAQAYNKTGNKAKYVEWTETALKAPELKPTSGRASILCNSMWTKRTFPKRPIMPGRRSKPPTLSRIPARKRKSSCARYAKPAHDTIGKILLEQDKFDEAIKSFQQALSFGKVQ